MGIVIEAVKVPVEDDVTVVGVVVNVVLSNFIVTALLGLKLEPVTDTLAPRLPAVGDNVIVPVMITLNVAVPDLPVVSVAEIV